MHTQQLETAILNLWKKEMVKVPAIITVQEAEQIISNFHSKINKVTQNVITNNSPNKTP